MFWIILRLICWNRRIVDSCLWWTCIQGSQASTRSAFFLLKRSKNQICVLVDFWRLKLNLLHWNKVTFCFVILIVLWTLREKRKIYVQKNSLKFSKTKITFTSLANNKGYNGKSYKNWKWDYNTQNQCNLPICLK